MGAATIFEPSITPLLAHLSARLPVVLQSRTDIRNVRADMTILLKLLVRLHFK
jgi:hypothetical protein